jgi:hypothetical protein
MVDERNNDKSEKKPLHENLKKTWDSDRQDKAIYQPERDELDDNDPPSDGSDD